MVVERSDYGTRIWAKLRVEGVGVGLERKDASVGTYDFIFVDGAFEKFREEKFPDAGGAPGTHGMNAAVPAVEIADNTHTRCAGGPDGEVDTPDSIDGFQMGAQFVVCVVMPALAHEMKIELGQQKRKGIGIVKLKRFASVPGTLNSVAAGRGSGGLAGRPGGFEETFGTELNGLGELCGSEGCAFDGGRPQRDGGLGGSGKKKPHDPSAGNGMGAEEGKGIRVATSENGIDL